jgi:hypothetical protein
MDAHVKGSSSDCKVLIQKEMKTKFDLEKEMCDRATLGIILIKENNSKKTSDEPTAQSSAVGSNENDSEEASSSSKKDFGFTVTVSEKDLGLDGYTAISIKSNGTGVTRESFFRAVSEAMSYTSVGRIVNAKVAQYKPPFFLREHDDDEEDDLEDHEGDEGDEEEDDDDVDDDDDDDEGE